MSTIDLTKRGPDQPGPDRTPGPDRHLAPLIGTRKPTRLDTSQPIRPEWQKDLRSAYITARLFWHRTWYCTRKHLYYSPVYVGLLLVFAPRGLARLVASLSAYLYDNDTAALRHQHAGAGDTGEAAKAQAIRKSNLKARWMVAVSVLTVVLVPVLAWTAPAALAVIVAALAFVWTVKLIPGREMWELGVAVVVAAGVWWFTPLAAARIPAPPLWAVLGLAVGGVFVLGWHGRNHDKPIVKATDFVAGKVIEKPTAEMVIDALCRIGVPGMTLAVNDRVKEEVRVRAPGVARSARGYTIEMELPPGITAAAVMDKREALAGALRRPLGTVWPSKAADHPGHLRIFLSDVPMATAPQPRWPIAKGQPIDIFEPFPMFTDEEGEWVDITLLDHVAMGGASGFGKSVGLRQLGVALTFDLRTRIYVFDGKISGDLDPVRKVAHSYYEGADPDDVAEQLGALKGIETEMRRRSRFLRDLPVEERSPKVTSTLASKYSGLSPIVVLIDECQEYTEYGTKGNKPEMKIREEFRAVLTRLSRLGRSAAIHVVFVSQKPDADVLPSAIMGNCSVRVCFKVTEQVHNDQILGTGAYKSGLKATLFSQEDRGLAWLKASGEPKVVRTWSEMVELGTAVELVEKAHALRAAAGLLTGQAAGEEQLQLLEPDLMADVRDVMEHPPVTAMSLGALRDALTLLRPATWGHLDVDALGSMLRAAGVKVGTVWAEGRSAKGIKTADVAELEDADDDLTEADGT